MPSPVNCPFSSFFTPFANAGLLEITQTDDSAIPSDSCGIFLDYYTYRPAFSVRKMQDASVGI